jgi:hypothetical protein
MAVTITATPNTGIVATKTVVRFDIAGSTPNDAGDYDADQYPTQAENRFVLAMREGATEKGRSQVFGTSPAGAFQFNGYIFPDAGTYTVALVNVTNPASESDVSDTLELVVS